MKCPECKAKIPKKAEFCPECSHQLTEEEKKAGKKKGKVLWFILGPVLAIILGFAIFVFIVGFVSSSYELVEIDVTSQNVDYDAPVPIEISVEGSGMVSKTFEIPVYIDGSPVHTFVIEYPGSKMGAITTITESTQITCDASTKPGTHTAAADELSDSFSVRTAAAFSFSSDADLYYYLTNNSYSVECTVKNTGETAGEADCLASLDGTTVDERTLTVAGESEQSFLIDLSAESEGSHTFTFAGQTYDMPFYDAVRPETGKLMENTVKGYGYIDFDNLTASDMVVYVTRSDDNSTAVIARYIRAGEKHRLNSIVHGEYDIFVQTGSNYVPEFDEFYTDQGMYYVGSIDLDNNVVGGSGYYTYVDIDMTQTNFEAWRTAIDFTPAIPDNM